MTVKERFELGVVAQERCEDFLGHNGGCQRQIASSQTLGKSHQIRPDSFLFAGKHCPCAAKPCQYFIGNQQGTVLIAQLADFRERSLGPQPHSGSALNQGLNTDSCCRVVQNRTEAGDVLDMLDFK